MVIKENIKIDSRNSDSIDESTNSLVENVKKVSPLPWLCFVSEPREVYVSTSPDGWDYYDIVVDITCYHYTATRLVPMY